MDQYVLVKFATDRTVVVDGTPCGATNQVLVVQQGTHSFSLGEPKDYIPLVILKLVVGTSQQKPMSISFDLPGNLPGA
jgi:hypothetical protein